MTDTALVPTKGQEINGAAMQTTVRALQPQSFAELMQFADMICRSPFIPKEFIGKPGDILAAVQYGAELGFPAMQALQSICVINGKPSLYGDAMLALVRKSGTLEEFDETHEFDAKGNVVAATCTAKRRGQTAKTGRFSMQDAERAGLLAKGGNWKNYPQRMLTFRARSWVLRDLFTDILKGMQMAEEVQDYESIDVTESSYALPTMPPSRGVDAVKQRIAARAEPKPGEIALSRYIECANALGIQFASQTDALQDIRERMGVGPEHKLTAAEIDDVAAKLHHTSQSAEVPVASRALFVEAAKAAGYPIQSDADAESLARTFLEIPRENKEPLTDAQYAQAIDEISGPVGETAAKPATAESAEKANIFADE